MRLNPPVIWCNWHKAMMEAWREKRPFQFMEQRYTPKSSQGPVAYLRMR